ncbi:keratin-associated protein 10-3-like [Orussus abietinus]|uniref:keratin-associated protein 10-3-like n=1 Tax=Orussus abietinus TaxID=222816 RepID=UPI000C715AEC|nr:keratin-associated protein 10-3-like [Orussus abietinus]
MSCCEGSIGSDRFPGTGCCGSTCAGSKAGCSASEPRIRSCFCQRNVGCLDRADCGGFRPRGTAATGACPGPCQCAEEEAWNRNVPPKPNCEWLSNFSELRRQWSDHGRRNTCKCCNCRPWPILKKRSCCQCIGGYCLCQPMARTCNCPPPVQVDARAERECSCDCPSSPECACPPSERRFPRTKVKCPNARLCCPMPRLPPGPKCCCTRCQPCLPPPCDPCTSTKCRGKVPQVAPCRPRSPCPPKSPCRPGSPPPPVCRPLPPCASCRKMAPPCRSPETSSTTDSTRRLASGCSAPGRGSDVVESLSSLSEKNSCLKFSTDRERHDESRECPIEEITDDDPS